MSSTTTHDPGSGMGSHKPVRTAVVIGSTREGRAGQAIGRWFAEAVQQDQGIEVDLIDLADYSFPDQYPKHETAQMKGFTGRIDAAEAFVVVTPEYNHGYPASLKRAIDYGCDEWFAKPVGFVAYGATAQGLRAVEQLRQVFAALHMMTIPAVVSFNLFDGSVTDDGRPRAAASPTVAVQQLLSQLRWWAHALRNARERHPYVA
jgi:NAD(P)H-dependent FMN reductase